MSSQAADWGVMQGESWADRAACRALLCGGSKSFHLAGRLLPPRVGADAAALYAFCRVADDAIDGGGGRAALGRLRERLFRAYAGQPFDLPSDRALASVVAAHGIPRALPEALLEGFAWDAEGRRYATISELRAYAARVAGAVGAMMALLMGVRDPDAIAQACALGVAMQLSNVARDVGEDARAGRVYLPLDWLREAGIDPDAFVAAPEAGPGLTQVLQRLLAEAGRLYAAAEPGIARLPRACRPGIWAARLIYDEIGLQVARDGVDPVTARAVVPTSRKLALLARVPLAMRRAPTLAAAPLAETDFLVQAVRHAPPPRRAAAMPALEPVGGGVSGRVEWVVALMDRLERVQRMEQAHL